MKEIDGIFRRCQNNNQSEGLGRGSGRQCPTLPHRQPRGRGRTARGRACTEAHSPPTHGRSREDTLSHPGRAAGGNSSTALTRPGASALSKAPPPPPPTFLRPSRRLGVEDGDWAHCLVRASRGSLEPMRAEHKVGWEARPWRGHSAPARTWVLGLCSHGCPFSSETPTNALLSLKGRLLPVASAFHCSTSKIIPKARLTAEEAGALASSVGSPSHPALQTRGPVMAPGP